MPFSGCEKWNGGIKTDSEIGCCVAWRQDQMARCPRNKGETPSEDPEGVEPPWLPASGTCRGHIPVVGHLPVSGSLLQKT